MVPRVVRAAVLAVAIGACSFLPGRQFGYTFPADGDRAALPVVLTDTTGNVVALDEAPAGFRPVIDPGIATAPQDPNAVVIHWTGGACDELVSITTEGAPSVTFVVTTTVKPIDCDAFAVSRAVLVQLAGRADMSRLGVRFEPLLR